LSVVFHAAYNITIAIMLSAWPAFPIITFFALCWVLAIVIVVLARKQFLNAAVMRGRSAADSQYCSRRRPPSA
jgi:type III secretory pathway component EscV